MSSIPHAGVCEPCFSPALTLKRRALHERVFYEARLICLSFLFEKYICAKVYEEATVFCQQPERVD